MKLGLALLAFALAAGPVAARQADKPLLTIDGLPLGQLPTQQLPAAGCAAYLWSKGTTHALVAMASADPAQLRLSLDGTIADYPRTAQQGAGGFGFAGTTTYQASDVTAILTMNVQADGDLTQGATVPTGTLTLERTSKDSIVMPVGGLIGCAAHRKATG
jgi:hypothetical protein